MLSQAELKLHLKYNPDTGVFTWMCIRQGRRVNGVAGTVAKHYVHIWLNNIKYKAHRLAFLYMTGELPDVDVDHIDGNLANNKWSNLRLATTAQNRCNSVIRKDSKTGVKNVVKHKSGKFYGRIKFAGETYYTKSFEELDDARVATNELRQKVHGNFSNNGGII